MSLIVVKILEKAIEKIGYELSVKKHDVDDSQKEIDSAIKSLSSAEAKHRAYLDEYNLIKDNLDEVKYHLDILREEFPESIAHGAIDVAVLQQIPVTEEHVELDTADVPVYIQ